MSMTISSPAFRHDDDMPPHMTCDGAAGRHDVSPPLVWTNVPSGTRSLVLIVDDPDAPDPQAPKTTWVHWLIYNLPPDSTGLPEGVHQRDLPGGAHEGINDFKRTAYGGPCPPVGKHRYFFKLAALDVVLPTMKSPTKAELESAMHGHVIAKAELVGRYQKHGR